MSRGAITSDFISEMRKKFYADNQNVLAQNLCTKQDFIDMIMSRKSIENTNHVFTHKIDFEGKPTTDQKKSGRCWIFSFLNCMRIPFMKHFNIEEFEFSQSYIYFWSTIERCNYTLHNYVKAAKQGEQVNGRLIHHLLKEPIEDGGQWNLFHNLVNKYGVMPKSCFPDSYTGENSSRANDILCSKLRENAKTLLDLVKLNASDDSIEAKINEQMSVIFRIVGILFGIPSETFTWEYYDKSKNYNIIGPITPLEFYNKYVRDHYDVNDKICLVSDPRPNNPFNQLYTIDYLVNVMGMPPTTYNNQLPDKILKFITESIKQNEAVAFGCHIFRRYSYKQGFQDIDCHNYKALFGTDVYMELSKADRMIFCDSFMTHAMNITAVSLDKNGLVTKMRVENSWSTEKGDKGYNVMTREWFNEFVYEVILDKKYLTPDILAVQKQKPIILPPWDPLGTLAS